MTITVRILDALLEDLGEIAFLGRGMRPPWRARLLIIDRRTT